MLKNHVFGRVKTQVVDAASGGLVRESAWKENMIYDTGLNRLAGGLGFAGLFQFCQVGSSAAGNSVASGAITFTQSGTTITASASFFTSGMTGAILKYGTGSGGQEQYITFVNATTATSAISFTQSTPIVGTVWLVQQTSLVSFLFASNNYQTTGSSNSTIFSGNQVTLQRTFIFPVQGSTYNVNEIGYYNTSGGSACFGRVVLSSTDTITPTQFYVVIMQMTYTISPGTPTSVSNVGTNINTAGTAMSDYWDCAVVASNGTTTNAQGATNSGYMDGTGTLGIGLYVAADSQQSSPVSSGHPITNPDIYLGNFPAFSNSGQPVGVGVSTLNYSVSAGGQSINSLRWGFSGARSDFTINLTGAFSAPTGAFAGSVTMQLTFTRTLVN